MGSHETENPPPTRGQMAAEISTAVVQLLSQYTGRGPTHARTTVADDHVVCLLGDTLLKAEHSLVADGKEDAVLEMRRLFQMTMREDLVAAVEQATGARVVAFMSDNHVHPDMAAEVFVLDGPPRGHGDEGAHEGSGSS